VLGVAVALSCRRLSRSSAACSPGDEPPIVVRKAECGSEGALADDATSTLDEGTVFVSSATCWLPASSGWNISGIAMKLGEGRPVLGWTSVAPPGASGMLGSAGVDRKGAGAARETGPLAERASGCTEDAPLPAAV